MMNAVQATRDIRKIDVTVSREAREFHSPEKKTGTPGMIIQVRDYGEGLDPAVAETIFNPFVTTRPGGTGLGLAIVKKFVLLHNGFITFSTAPDQGTIVTIMIPGKYDPNQTRKIYFGEFSETEKSQA